MSDPLRSEFPQPAGTLPRKVRIVAPARLHLGFVDVSGSAGRRYGSIGLTIAGFDTILEAWRLPEGAGIEVIPGAETGPAEGSAQELSGRIQSGLERLAAHLGQPLNMRCQAVQRAPAHGGFGTGTQLALVLSAAVLSLHGLPGAARQLAAVLDRGQRSGIGLGAFERGGFIVDGGRAPDAPAHQTPPTIAGLPFPADWRVLLILDRAHAGLSGSAETRAFAALEPFPPQAAHRLAHRVLMGVLPALAEQDVVGFGQAVGDIQRVVGDHFAPVQGSRFTSPAVTAALAWLEEQGIAGVGQSSWGPTGFAVIGSPGEAEQLLAGLRARWPGPDLDFLLTAGRNAGAVIETS